MRHAEILHRCFRCGYCKLPGSYQDLNCPSYLKFMFETYAPGGRMWLLRAWLDGEIETSPHLAEILFSCAACGNCVEHCAFPEFKADLLDAFTAGREELVEQGAVPRTVANYLELIHLYGNPYGLPEADRGNWADGLGIQPYSSQEYLFYVGCPGSYDERGRRMARAVAGLLTRLDVDFGIFGEQERCDGNEVRALGETGLFERLAKENVEQWNAAGVEKIIALSPHGFHAIRNDYPRFGGAFEVHHYPQVLAGLLANKKFGRKDPRPLRVTFHDPCYLGRHNKDYSTPRAVLGALPGLELVEMERSMADALCCGGGGGNFFTDVLGGGAESASRVRVREAALTGAQILAVACPKCAKMLEDAIQAEALEEELRVMDVAELVEGRAAPG
jgi:Fe-S oxidoreductase